MMHCSAIQANSLLHCESGLLHCREGVQCDAGWRVVSAFERGGAVYNEAHYASSSFSFDTLQCRPMQCSRLQFIMRHITPPPPPLSNARQCRAMQCILRKYSRDSLPLLQSVHFLHAPPRLVLQRIFPNTTIKLCIAAADATL